MADRERIQEEFIVLRCQLGDLDAYKALLELMEDRLVYYLRRLRADDAMVHDVLQEVWIVVFRRLRRLRRVESFRSWIYRLAHDKAVSHVRAEFSRERAEATYSERNHVENDDEALNQADASTIHELLQKLSPVHREVLTLFFLEDMKYEEIAEVTRWSVGTVKSRLFYAKKAMRGLLDGGLNR